MDEITRVDVTSLIDELLEDQRDAGRIDVGALVERICASVSNEQKINEWCQRLTRRVAERIAEQRRMTWTPEDEDRTRRAVADALDRRNGSRQQSLSFLERHADALVRRELRQLVHVPSLGRWVLRGEVTREQQLELVEVHERDAARHQAWADFERRLFQVIPSEGTMGDVATETLHELFSGKPHT